MTKKELGVVVKIGVPLLIAVGLLIVSSCKKSPEDGSREATSQSAPEQKQQDVQKEPVEAPKAETSPAAKAEETAPAPAAADGLVPIDIKLPKPLFAGTPQNIKVTNLEKPLGKPRPPFLVPAGTKNVALGRSVVSTDEEPIIGEIAMITDGDKEASDGSYVELAPFKQNVTIDLGAEYNIYAVLLWHYHKEARVYLDVVVQVADDPDFITNVRTLFNNDDDNSSGLGLGSDMHYVETAEGKLIDGKGARARYVRLYSNGSSSNELNHYIEVEVYGTPSGS